MDLISRYIYAVTKNLPEKQRDDINKELRSLINDMLEQIQGDKTHEDKVKQALKNLGDPKELASKYRGSAKYLNLIGPKNVDSYLMILKIVSLAVFIGVTLSAILGGVFPYVEVAEISIRDIVSIIAGYIWSIFAALLQGFALVTIIFAIAEYFQKNETSSNSEWSLSDLPEVPEKDARIVSTDLVFSIIFTTIFTYILIFNPDLLALYSRSSGIMTSTPIFNAEGLYNFRFLIVVIFILNISKEIIKMIWGSWRINLAVIPSMITIFSMTLMLILISRPEIWNANFTEELSKTVNIGINPITALLTIIFVGSVVDIAVSAYKGVKYNNVKA